MTIKREERLAKGLMRIGEIAQSAGVPVTTVRYYTDLGLIHSSGHTFGGHHLYEMDETLARMRKIQEEKMRVRSLLDLRDRWEMENSKNMEAFL